MPHAELPPPTPPARACPSQGGRWGTGRLALQAASYLCVAPFPELWHTTSNDVIFGVGTNVMVSWFHVMRFQKHTLRPGIEPGSSA